MSSNFSKTETILFSEVLPGVDIYSVLEEAKEIVEKNKKPIFFFFNDTPLFMRLDSNVDDVLREYFERRQ